MASFSERHGYKEVRTFIQRESLDDETRLALWNTVAFMMEVFGKLRGGLYSEADDTEPGVLSLDPPTGWRDGRDFGLSRFAGRGQR